MRERHFLAVSLLLLAASFTSPTLAQGPGDGGSAVAAVSLLPSQAVQERLDGLFYDWNTFQLDLAAAERAVRKTGHVQLELGGRLFDLELQPNDVRAPGYVEIHHTRRGQVRARSSAVATFKGIVAGEPDSVVRLLILPDLLQGYIKSGEEWLFIDPLTKYAKGQSTSHIVVFDERDLRPEAAGLCGVGELSRLAAESAIEPTSSVGDSIRVVTADATFRRVDLATEADYEYFSIYGVNANSQIQGVVNQVDGIYRPELSVNLRIVFQSVWMVSGDPYTSSNHDTLTGQFRDYWNTHRGDVARDTAHLFTGRDLDGNTVGAAWRAVLCNNPSLSYGISQNTGLMAKLVAHEIGHNLSAEHDNQVSPPASTCDGFGTIMCSSIQSFGPNSFSQRSKNDISSHVANHGGCLEKVLIEPPASSNGPAFFEHYFGWGNLGQCGYDTQGLLYGSQGVEAGTWTMP
ncbi:MAG TPA: M12 family metallo-peptidase, partial [Thermoanaerobaculia bacterium]|nr:M12 family metallo-peptidase [Thermoanaerobaculia bacterium]